MNNALVKVYDPLVKVNDVIYKVYKVIMMILLALMSIWVFAQVIVRETQAIARMRMPFSTSWLEEFTIYAFSWLTYFGAANVLRNDGHLCVSAITNMIQRKSPTARKVVAVISYLIIGAFCCIVCYYSFTLVMKYLNNGSTSTNVRWIKMGWIFMQIPINYIVYILFEIEKILGVITGKREVK